MKFPNRYPFLKQNHFSKGEYSIVPIRFEDRMDIMKWRNEQIYHLRQSQPLTEEIQNEYFENVVSRLFEQEKPQQILFSYLKNGECIGYGGLVHINWIDKNAEISFVMDTSLEEEEFELHWVTYLKLLEKVAFEGLNFHKIFTYAFDLRPHLYQAVEKAGFTKEAVLKEHCFFEGEFKDVVIHSKFNNTLTLRKLSEADIDFTFLLANDSLTRENSYSQDPISYQIHQKWLLQKIIDKSAFYFIGQMNRISVCFVRVDRKDKENVIGITVNKEFRGKKLSSRFLELISSRFCKEFTDEKISAYIKKNNLASIKSFENAGYIFDCTCNVDGVDSLKYVYEK